MADKVKEPSVNPLLDRILKLAEEAAEIMKSRADTGWMLARNDVEDFRKLIRPVEPGLHDWKTALARLKESPGTEMKVAVAKDHNLAYTIRCRWILKHKCRARFRKDWPGHYSIFATYPRS